MVTRADFKPDETMAAHIAANVAGLTLGQNIFAGSRQAYNLKTGMPREVVFVLAGGGSRSRAIKGGPNEARPICTITIRSSGAGDASSFQTGQQLARDVLFAVDQDPPAGWIEFRAFDSHPEYEGRDDNGSHLWTFTVEVIVDVTP